MTFTYLIYLLGALTFSTAATAAVFWIVDRLERR